MVLMPAWKYSHSLPLQNIFQADRAHILSLFRSSHFLYREVLNRDWGKSLHLKYRTRRCGVASILFNQPDILSFEISMSVVYECWDSDGCRISNDPYIEEYQPEYKIPALLGVLEACRALSVNFGVPKSADQYPGDEEGVEYAYHYYSMYLLIPCK